MSQKFRIILFFSFVFFYCFFNIHPAVAAETRELKFTTQDFSPFSYYQGNEVAGPAVDIIQLVCQDMGVDCSFRLYPWSRAQQLVREGAANGMFVIGWNKKRTEWLYFSPPILVTEYGFFVEKDNPLEFKKLADVKGYTIGVFGPSNTSRSLTKIKQEIGDLKIDMTPDDESAFRKLSIGRISAVFSNRDVGYALIKKLNLENIRYAGRQRSLNYYIGFSQQYNEKQIVDKFNDTFIELHKKGLIQKTLKQYNMTPCNLTKDSK